MVPATGTAGAATTSTTVTTTRLAVPAAVAATKAAAARIHTMAELKAAPAAVRAYFLAPATLTATITRTEVTKGADVKAGFVCDDAEAAYQVASSLGFEIFSTTDDTNNWCWGRNLYGYWVISSQPNGYDSVTTAWGYAYCGDSGEYRNWINDPYEWGISQTSYFFPGECVYTEGDAAFYLAEQVYGNGAYPYQKSLNPGLS